MKLSKNQKALILSHFYKRSTVGGGPPQDIRDYLIQKIGVIAYIEHPFPYADDNKSSLSIYSNGVLTKKIFGPAIFGPEWLFYIMDVFVTFYFYLRAPLVFDFCIALDNLNTFSVILLRKIGLIKRLIFYSIDYTPYRFYSPLLNNIYHSIDKIACYNSDLIWVLSPIMTTLRKKRGIKPIRTAPSITLPMGANLNKIKVLAFNKIDRFQIVYVGSLIKKQGLQIVLESLPNILKNVPKVKIIVIGKGDYEKQLKSLSNSLKIDKYVKFMGFIENHRDVEKILTHSAISVAPYIPEKENYAYYTDPGKPKLYLGCGLPVVITDVPKIAKIIHSRKAGILVKYDIKSMSEAIISLLTDTAKYKQMRSNALDLSKQYDTDTLISKAIQKI